MCYTITLIAQSNSHESINSKIILLKKILDRADTLTTAEAQGYNDDYSELLDSNFDINLEISIYLLDILNSPDISNYNLDSLLSHNFLGISHSKDNRLWFFSWYSNNGGSWIIMDNIIHYRTLSNRPKNYIDLSLEDNPNSFCARSSWFGQIYKLNSTQNKELYLCLSSSRYCSTCCSEIASVFELTSDSINFNYPAFLEDGTNYSSCFSLGSRCGDIENFTFSEDNMTISFTYTTDDYTPIQREENQKTKKISGKLKWDGIKFN